MTLRESGEFSLPQISCIIYIIINKYFTGEPVNIHRKIMDEYYSGEQLGIYHRKSVRINYHYFVVM